MRGHIDIALQHFDVLLIGEQLFDPTDHCVDISRLEVRPGLLVDVDDDRGQRLEPGKERIVLQQLDHLRGPRLRLVGKGVVVLREFDQAAMQRNQRAGDLPQRLAQASALWRIRRMHRAREE